jgi:hypothetical protein
MFFEGASPTAIEVPVLRVFDGDGTPHELAETNKPLDNARNE